MNIICFCICLFLRGTVCARKTFYVCIYCASFEFSYVYKWFCCILVGSCVFVCYCLSVCLICICLCLFIKNIFWVSVFLLLSNVCVYWCFCDVYVCASNCVSVYVSLIVIIYIFFCVWLCECMWVHFWQFSIYI